MPGKTKRTYKKKRFYKKKNTGVIKDSSRGSANKTGKILNIWSMNKSPVMPRRYVTMRYESYLTPTSVANVGSQSYFFSLGSLFDPNYQVNDAVASNTAVSGYGYWLGPLAGQYTKYRVNYVDVCVTGMNVTSGTIVKLVASCARGAGDYPTTTFIQDISLRRGAMSVDLEYFGDTREKTMKFRVYLNEVLGLTKSEYQSGFYVAYDANAGTAPWLAISIGDASQPNGSGGATISRGKISLEYHCVVTNPVMAGVQ